jgi:hypothetical protein
VEYALVVAAVAGLIITVVLLLGGKVNNLYDGAAQVDRRAPPRLPLRRTSYPASLATPNNYSEIYFRLG